MTYALTIWLAGMPCALVWLVRELWDAPDQADGLGHWSGIAAVAVFVVLWPVFLAIAVYENYLER